MHKAHNINILFKRCSYTVNNIILSFNEPRLRWCLIRNFIISNKLIKQKIIIHISTFKHVYQYKIKCNNHYIFGVDVFFW